MVNNWHAIIHEMHWKPLMNRLRGSKDNGDAILQSNDQFEKKPVAQLESSAEEIFREAVDSVEETVNTIQNKAKKASPKDVFHDAREYIDHSPYQMRHHSEAQPVKPREPETHRPESNPAHHSDDLPHNRHEEDPSRESSTPEEERTVPEKEGSANPKGREREERLPEGLTREEREQLERLEKEKTSFKNSDRAFETKVNFIQQFIREEKASYERSKRNTERHLAADKAHLSELEHSTIPQLFNTLISKLDALKRCSPQQALSEAQSLFSHCEIDIRKYSSQYALLNRPCPFDFTSMATQLECFRKDLMPLLEKKN